jgi:hypothetical protein
MERKVESLMKKHVVAAILLTAGACLSFAAQVHIDILEINRYYSDFNYIVATSTPEERAILARAVGTKRDASIPTDGRLRTLYEMMKGLRAAQADLDPGMTWGNRIGGDFLYAKIPISVSRMGTSRLVVHTIRRAVRNFSYSETDYWMNVGGTWRISVLHFYLIGG